MHTNIEQSILMKRKKIEEFSTYLFGFCILPSTILVVAVMPASGTLKDNYGYK